MLIESTNFTPPPQVRNLDIVRYIPGIAIAIGALILPVLILTLPQQKPTGTLLSPLPEGEVAATPASSPSALSFAASLNLAQNYLSKAYDLARNQNQNDEDKKAILTSLNRSLKQVDDTIKLDPQNPQGYLLRAQILTAISKINQKALDLAKQDFDTASRLSQNQNVTLPPAINPVDLLPDERAAGPEPVERAGIPQNLIVASPEASPSAARDAAASSSNASQGRVVLPTGAAELEVKNSQVLDSSYIYLVPQEKTNNPVYVKSKSSGSFIIAASQPPNTNQTIDYYIITD